MVSVDPNLGLSYGWTLGESGWKDGMDGNLKQLGAMVGLSVKDRDLGTPPASPVGDDRHLIPAGATGVWSGRSRAGRLRCALPVSGSFTRPESAGSASSRMRRCFRCTRRQGGVLASRSERPGPHKFVSKPAARRVSAFWRTKRWKNRKWSGASW
jgi:hypothetical protein